MTIPENILDVQQQQQVMKSRVRPVLSVVLLSTLATSSLLLSESYFARHKASENILFFDGVCNLCDGFVQFLAERDSTGRIRYAAIQEHTKELESLGAGKYAVGGSDALSTMVLAQNEIIYTRSTAALRTIALLDRPWRYFFALIVLPQHVRDILYKIVAKHRYRIFGQSETCHAPRSEFEDRFLGEKNKDVSSWMHKKGVFDA